MDGPPHPPSGGRDYEETPLLVTWEVTRACELACDHCRADATPDRHPDELSTAEGRALLEDIADFGEPPPIVVFSGGDPLERPDLLDLVGHADDLGLPAAVTPAPTASLDADTVAALADAGARRMALSLDGASPETHDGFRGEPGSFAAVRRAAEHADAVGLPIQINTTVTARTAPRLPAIADLVGALGAAMWEVFFLVPVGRGAELEALTPEDAERVFEWLRGRAREAPFRVITVEAPRYRVVADRIDPDGDGPTRPAGTTRAGEGFVFVSHTGEVYPSGFLPVSVGNVREASLVERYREAPLMERLREPDGFGGACGACPARKTCGGSRSRAYAATGDPLAPDPLCVRTDREPGRVNDGGDGDGGADGRVARRGDGSGPRSEEQPLSVSDRNTG